MKLSATSTRRSVSAILTGLFLTMLLVSAAQAQTTAFTYQGRFTDTTVAQPTNGTYQMQFALFDNANTAVGSAITVPAVQVVNGIFSINLDFGAGSFSGAARLLEIRVFNTAANGYITLAPRQPITSSPYSIRTINANFSDALSTACVGCVDNAKIASVAGSKVTGTVANATNATTATTAGNVTGIVAVANGGTGSATKNFVDTTTAQTVGGNKTFSNTVSAATLSAGTGGLNMNNNIVRLRDSADNNHGMIYNTTVDGPEFRAFSGFRWANGANGATERMRLDASGNLTVTGTISGTLANNSVGAAQVADGSLRLSDISVLNSTVALGSFTLGAHGCTALNLSGFGEVGDILNIYVADTTPGGIYIRPTFFTMAGSATVNICNTLNTNNTFPAQTLRVVILRP